MVSESAVDLLMEADILDVLINLVKLPNGATATVSSLAILFRDFSPMLVPLQQG